MFRLHNLVSTALYVASTGTLVLASSSISSTGLSKNLFGRELLRQEMIASQKNSIRRHLDVSQECLEASEEIWDNESVQWLSPMDSVDLCEDSPCDISAINPEYHANYKQNCKELDGQFIEYSVKVTEEYYMNESPVRNLRAPFYLTITNIPDCISKTCDANQMISLYQGQVLEQNMMGAEIGAEILFISDNSISKECMNGTNTFIMELDFKPPFAIECDWNSAPCDVSIVEPEYYANFNTDCESLGGKVVDYSIKFSENSYYGPTRKLQNETFYEVTNFPFCIDSSCDESHVASYLQGALGSSFVTSPTSSAESLGPIALVVPFISASIALLLFV